jgi:serine/threonine protein kinase
MTSRALELEWGTPGPGARIGGKYVVEGPCGRGDLAVVLSALRAGLDCRVAIKVLLPEWAAVPAIVERFLRAGRMATRVKSEHAARVFEVGTIEGGAPYLVTEYLEGQDLAQVLANWGPLPVPTAVDWILQAIEAIGEAHALGIIHRGLKPANLFLTRRADGIGCLKVADFGLTVAIDPRIDEAMRLMLRPDALQSRGYMAPEQLHDAGNTDARADIWAIGAILHELIAGELPFRGRTVPELCAAVFTQPPARISSARAETPAALERAILCCLEKDPNARFQTVTELAQALAPFGTAAAIASYERVARAEDGASASMSMLEVPRVSPLPQEDLTSASWPGDASDAAAPRRVLGSPASARIVIGSFLMLAGFGIGVFMFMYASVHGDDHRNVGVTERQAPPRRETSIEMPTPTAAAPESTPVPPPATIAAPATALPATVAAAAPAAGAPAAPSPAGPSMESVPSTAPAVGAQVSGARPDASPVPSRSVLPPPRPRIRTPSPTVRLRARPAEAPAQPDPFARAPSRPAEPAATSDPDHRDDAPAKSPPSGDDLFDGRK